MRHSVQNLLFVCACYFATISYAQGNPAQLPEISFGGFRSTPQIGGSSGGGGNSRPHTIWDLLVEKAEGYMQSMLFCTLSRPDLRDGVSEIKPCEQSPLSMAIVENLVTLLDVPNATSEKREEAVNKMVQACNSLEQIGSQTCELENFRRVQDCFNNQQVLEQYFKLAGLDSLCGAGGNQTDLNGMFQTFWNKGGKDCMNPISFDRLSQDSLLCFELIKTHPKWELKEMTSCIADQFKKCGGTGAKDAVMPLLEGIQKAYRDIRR